MAQNYDYDLVVIGSGPGGYVAAIRASQLGLKAAIIEKDKPGGVCLNIGCIPSKALIHQAEVYSHISELSSLGVTVDTKGFDYSKVFKKSRVAAEKLSKGVQFLLKKNGVEFISGRGTIVSQHEVSIDDGKKVSGKFLLVATGSRPKEIPGFEFDEKQVISSTGGLMLEKLPSKMIILGAGYIGMEFAHIMNSFGVDVTVVEMLDQILPLSDAEAVDVLYKQFKKRGIKMLTGTKASGLTRNQKGVKLTVESPDGKKEELAGDILMVAVGRSPNTEDVGLEKVGVKTDRGFVTVGDHYQTSVPGIYAIGDVTPSPLLAHVASKEGEIAVEHMAGKNPEKKLPADLIPAAIYTEPQLASIGPTEEELKKQGQSYKKATFPYRGAGKSVAVGQPEGMVKILYREDTHEILAAHVAGANATELIHELLLAKRTELLPEDIAETVHAHPTLSEAVMEAARAAEGWAIHV